MKDAYPLPRPDDVQDQLAGSIVFSVLDLQNGCWQLPVNPADQPKTAFSPGPGLGLFQFHRMPFGLARAPSSFQRLMDKVCWGLPFVAVYLDDVLIHSATAKEHEEHLRLVFQKQLQVSPCVGRNVALGCPKSPTWAMSFQPEVWNLTLRRPPQCRTGPP